MKVYKLTDKYGRTLNDTQWGENVTHEAVGDQEQDLCSDAFIHAYEHPLLAVLHAPIHGDCANYTRMWECEGHGGVERDVQMKCGFRFLTTIKEIEVPKVMLEQRVAYGIFCALEVCKNEDFRRWAEAWLSGEDRSEESASSASAMAAMAAVAAMAAMAAVAEAATWVAEAAAWAARADESLDLIALAEKAMEVEG